MPSKLFNWMFVSATNVATVTGRPAEDRKLFVTGDELIARITSAIEMRRPVLVTGPRGCGKSYCTKKALERARDRGKIAGWHFVQGNRELSRDYLSEDSLVIEGHAEPTLLEALALRPPSRDDDTYLQMREVRRNECKTWPGVPSGKLKSRDELWRPHGELTPWVALFLDEINRFSDGFLDSLLSLLEEGVIVRRGEELHVPIVVVATANPPGYDITAKKLSPPLQARIARSYRVSQPPLDYLVQVVLADKIARAGDDARLAMPVTVQYLAAAATLCLWGDPDAPSKGTSFLTPGTKILLRRAMQRDPVLASYMRQISNYVVFGPDARAVSDWVDCSRGLLKTRAADSDLKEADFCSALIDSAVEVLVHKLRETFNEGAEPEKPPLLERLVIQIVRRVLSYPALRSLFVIPYEQACERIEAFRGTSIAVSELFKKAGELHESRWHPWIEALADKRLSRASASPWVEALKEHGLVATDSAFLFERERAWMTELLASDDKENIKDIVSLTRQTPRAAVREALDGASFLQEFVPDLLALIEQNENALRDEAKHCGEWIQLLEDILDNNVADYEARLMTFMDGASAKPVFRGLVRQAVKLLMRDLGGPKDVVSAQLERLAKVAARV